MADAPQQPDDPLAFIKDCVDKGRIYWSYHVNMRMIARGIARRVILGGVDTYEIVESYPRDKYLPSFLILSRSSNDAFHILFATDVEDGNVRVVTAYRPDAREWEPDLRRRRAP